MSYWEERWAADLERALRKADEVIADIDRLHKRAENRIISMIKRIRRRFQMAYGLTEEEAAEQAALRQHGFGSFLRGLFHETADRETGGQGIALFDIAVTGLGTVGRDPEGDQGPFTGTVRSL